MVADCYPSTTGGGGGGGEGQSVRRLISRLSQNSTETRNSGETQETTDDVEVTIDTNALSFNEWSINIDIKLSLLRRGLHEVSSEGKVSAQGVMGRAK
jgi:hypothetical protein